MPNFRNQTTDPLTKQTPASRARAIREMFSAIAPRYDLLNRLLSLGVDRSWRRKAVDQLGWEDQPDGRYLDVCAGTYDLSIELARRRMFNGHVIALDFARAMLEKGRAKITRQPIAPVCGDALKIPARNRSFDGALVAFGVRNLADIDAGLRELQRTLRPGARLVLLDFSMPGRQPLRALYRLYFTRILPRVGRLVSKHSRAYTYLPESVLGFPEPAALAARMELAGFRAVGWRRLSGGIAALWWGAAS